MTSGGWPSPPFRCCLLKNLATLNYFTDRLHILFLTSIYKYFPWQGSRHIVTLSWVLFSSCFPANHLRYNRDHYLIRHRDNPNVPLVARMRPSWSSPSWPSASLSRGWSCCAAGRVCFPFLLRMPLLPIWFSHWDSRPAPISRRSSDHQVRPSSGRPMAIRPSSPTIRWRSGCLRRSYGWWTGDTWSFAFNHTCISISINVNISISTNNQHSHDPADIPKC